MQPGSCVACQQTAVVAVASLQSHWGHLVESQQRVGACVRVCVRVWMFQAQFKAMQHGVPPFTPLSHRRVAKQHKRQVSK